MPPKLLSVLVVDDSVDDVFFIERALSATSCLRVGGIVHDGSEAIAYLSGLGRYEDRKENPYPDVVLLDLKMPRQDGFKVLEWINTVEQRPKVIVLSSSSLDTDRSKAAALGADAFLVKPVAMDRWNDIVKALDRSLCTPS